MLGLLRGSRIRVFNLANIIAVFEGFIDAICASPCLVHVLSQELIKHKLKKMTYPGAYGTHGYGQPPQDQQQQYSNYLPPPQQQQYGNYPPPPQQYGNYPPPSQQYGNYPPPPPQQQGGFPQPSGYPPPPSQFGYSSPQQQQYPPPPTSNYGNYPPPSSDTVSFITKWTWINRIHNSIT